MAYQFHDRIEKRYNDCLELCGLKGYDAWDLAIAGDDGKTFGVFYDNNSVVKMGRETFGKTVFVQKLFPIDDTAYVMFQFLISKEDVRYPLAPSKYAGRSLENVLNKAGKMIVFPLGRKDHPTLQKLVDYLQNPPPIETQVEEELETVA